MLDLETTSMKPDAGAIVDVAALRVRDGQVVDRFESLVNPGRSIIGHQIHGISDGDVSGAPAVGDVIGKLVEFIGQAPVVAHNVAFDLPFITRNLPAGHLVGAVRGLRHPRARVPALPGRRQLQACRPRALRLRP